MNKNEKSFQFHFVSRVFLANETTSLNRLPLTALIIDNPRLYPVTHLSLTVSCVQNGAYASLLVSARPPACNCQNIVM